MQEIDKFNQKINVIPNGLEIYMNSMLRQNLVLINSIQFMSSTSLKNWFKTCQTINLTICHNSFVEVSYS